MFGRGALSSSAAQEAVVRLRYGRACPAVAGAARSERPPSPFGLPPSLFELRRTGRRDSLRYDRACPAVAGAASEGWWGKKDSNLRSHKTADLQSAPFATRDTPPFNSITNPTANWRRMRPWMILIPGADWRTPGRRVYGRRAMAKSTNGSRQKRG